MACLPSSTGPLGDDEAASEIPVPPSHPPLVETAHQHGATGYHPVGRMLEELSNGSHGRGWVGQHD